MRRCSLCGSEGPFHKSKANRDGQTSWCKACIAQKGWEAHILRTYNLGRAEYDLMLADQGGVCAICRQDCPTGKRLAVDHDHETGAVRQLLCTNCNKALGHAKDDPTLLRLMADYLERHASGQ